MAKPTEKKPAAAKPAAAAKPQTSHTHLVGPVQETDTIPPKIRADSPYRAAVTELEPGQNRRFPKAARNNVLRYAKDAGFTIETRSVDDQTFTLYRVS